MGWVPGPMRTSVVALFIGVLIGFLGMDKIGGGKIGIVVRGDILVVEKLIVGGK